MSGVVLRCPNCGTTHAEPGECDACHEAAVRPFCTNHTPGRWLDGPRCDACGARLGETTPAPRPAPRPVPPLRPPPRRDAPLAPAPARPRAPTGGTFDEPRDDTRRSPVGVPVEPEPAVRPRGRVAIEFPGVPGFPGFSTGRRRRGAPSGFGFPSGLPRAVRVGTGSVLGCFSRVVLTLLALLALLAAGFFGLLGASGGARRWVTDFGRQVGVVDGVPDQTARGIAAYRAGDRAGAERALADAARDYPRSAVALLYLARLRLDAGDDFRARAHLIEAVRREPESPLVRQTVRAYACALAARGRTADAADLLARVGASTDVSAECTGEGAREGSAP